MFYVFYTGTCSGKPHYHVELLVGALERCRMERKVSKWMMMKILIILSDLICNCIAVSSIFIHFHGVVKIKFRSLKKTDYANLHKVVHVIMLTQERPQSI